MCQPGGAQQMQAAVGFEAAQGMGPPQLVSRGFSHVVEVAAQAFDQVDPGADDGAGAGVVAFAQLRGDCKSFLDAALAGAVAGAFGTHAIGGERVRVGRDARVQAGQQARTGPAHKASSRLLTAIRALRCRVVHGGGRSALATNRPTAAVGNPCSTRRGSHSADLTCVRRTTEGIDRLPCPCGDCLRRWPLEGPSETRSPQGAGRPRRAPRYSARQAKLERLFMSFPPRLPTRVVIPQRPGVCL